VRLDGVIHARKKQIWKNFLRKAVAQKRAVLMTMMMIWHHSSLQSFIVCTFQQIPVLLDGQTKENEMGGVFCFNLIFSVWIMIKRIMETNCYENAKMG
jgi:hypothetical protein